MARPDLPVVRDYVERWHAYYLFAFDDGQRMSPRRDVPPDLEPPELAFDLPQSVRQDFIMATMMLVLANYDHEAFISFWAWGSFWEMLANVDEAVLGRIEVEARRTPRFRWMLTLIHTHGLKAVEEMLERASGSMTYADTMPARPF
ncbi:MAG: hypothetical protein ABL882_01145 [Sphingopyxis sp.]